MCGITGFFSITNNGFNTESQLSAIVESMSNSIFHRGPDDSGTWVDAENGIALGHRRLSILDLSPLGSQPMNSHSGRYVIAFNGEIYNHMSLRNELDTQNKVRNQGCNLLNWKGHSDTETLLASIEEWGIETTLKKVVGMFAFALWDKKKHVLTLGRDRIGEKPLYYGWVGDENSKVFAFGSELKAMKSFPGFNNKVCRSSLAMYLRYNYVPCPFSIFENIYKLEPGCVMDITLKAPVNPPQQFIEPGGIYDSISIKRWWSLGDVVISGYMNPIRNESEAIEIIENQLAETIKLQTIADVPLGAFLSGGIDSSLVVALMQKHSSKPINTFTIGFEESNFDESKYAKTVSNILGTSHNEIVVSPEMAMETITNLARIYDEPFADSSQIPTFLVSKLASQQVTVVLSGDGGDEIFGGYNRYLMGPKFWNKMNYLPYFVRKSIGKSISKIPFELLERAIMPLEFLSRTEGLPHLTSKLYKVGQRFIDIHNCEQLYLSLVSEWNDPTIVIQCENGNSLSEHRDLRYAGRPSIINESSAHMMMYNDFLSYLPDDILCKVDRAGMANSIETRIPFLDHRMVELAWRIPETMKIRENTGKWILKEVLYKSVPAHYFNRPKAGFAIPVGQWLRTNLKDWADNLLSEKKIREQGYFNASIIRKLWEEHLNGKRDWTYRLWSILVFQMWLEE
jgi:asparagine synthase (glutamine-hydrolysing)